MRSPHNVPWRRGVVFIKELVPRSAVAYMARRIHDENYVAVWQARDPELHCDVAGLYGAQFAESLQGRPSSAFLAEGSSVQVLKGQRLS